MLLTDYDYDLPETLIAQHPIEHRDQSRLMVMNRADGTITHKNSMICWIIYKPAIPWFLMIQRLFPLVCLAGDWERAAGWKFCFYSAFQIMNGMFWFGQGKIASWRRDYFSAMNFLAGLLRGQILEGGGFGLNTAASLNPSWIVWVRNAAAALY